MNHASFYQMQLQNCSFICCNLLGSDFSEVKAQGVSFEGSNLQDVVFERTDLRKANLLATQGLFLDPDQKLCILPRRRLRAVQRNLERKDSATIAMRVILPRTLEPEGLRSPYLSTFQHQVPDKYHRPRKPLHNTRH